MNKFSKILPAMIILCIIGALFGGDGRSKDEPPKEVSKDTVIAAGNVFEYAPQVIAAYKGSEGKKDPVKPDDPAGNVPEAGDKALNELEVHFLDVGQGDATLIKCGREAMIVDGGDDSKGTAIQLYLKKQNIESLKYVVATHPDADHVGGLDVVIYKFDCGQILLPNCEKDTSSFDQLQQSMEAKGYTPHVVDVGEQYTLGDARIEILSPSAEFTFADTNDSSIVFRLDHGNNSFLFTGDATIPPQQALIYDPDLDIDVDVLKVPHHGAATAYIKGFYDEVSPEYAVISCGKGNSYGHPRMEVLNDLKSRGTKLFRTDEQGTIVALSDGNSIVFSSEPSTTWLPGETNESDSSRNTVETPAASGFVHDLSETPEAGVTYVYNSNTKKFHRPDCSSVTDIKPTNRVDLTCTREELLAAYPNAKPCKRCNP